MVSEMMEKNQNKAKTYHMLFLYNTTEEVIVIIW